MGIVVPRRRHANVLSRVALVLGLMTSGLPTQVVSQITPADSAAVLLDAARLLEARGRLEAAEALYQLLVERYGDTTSGAAARDRLSGRTGQRLGQSSRTEMQVWATTFGLWLGVAVPAAFGANDSPPYGVGLLLGGPAGLLAGRALARSALGPGQTRAITFGGTWGTWQGFGLAEVLDLGEDLACDLDFCYADSGTEERFAAMVVGGVAGVVAGSLIARRPVGHAVATAANHGALWGTWLGFASATLADVEGDDQLLATLVAGNAGLVLGAWAADRSGWSRNRIRMVSVGGVIGGLGGLGVDLIAQGESEKTAVGIALAGSLVGLAIAAGTTGGMDSSLRGDNGEGGAALLNIGDGHIRLGAPLPLPTVVPVDGGGARQWRPALSVPLLRATF
jgi:hypothetical protein